MRTTLIVVTLAWLSACGSESDPDVTAAAPPPKPVAPAPKPAPAPADPIAKMARAVGNGKPGAAVDIRYEFSSKPALGTPTELELAFIPRAGVDGLDAKITGMDGITLAGELTPSYTQVEAGQAYTHTFSVLPNRSGVFYITVSVTTHIGGSSVGRTFSIPFVVGNVPAQQKAAPRKDASGQPIEPMKAEETTDRSG